jgi:hypothetical protein
MRGSRVLARVEMSDDGKQRGDRRAVMESFGDAILVIETMARPGRSPTVRWYAQRWAEPRDRKTRHKSRHRVRQALAGALFALASVLAVPGQRERVSAS